MIYYGFDPGKMTGVVGVKVDENKRISPAMVPCNMSVKGLYYFLEQEEMYSRKCVLIVEGFWLEPYKDPKKNLAWDPMIASQVIGALYYFAHRTETEVITQKNSIKPVGYGFANQKYTPGKKGTHWQDAMAHVYYYLVTQKLGLPA